VYDLAQSLERVLLTHNTEDFHELHRKRPGHRGIMAVYRDADPRKNMNHAQLAAAIRRLETSGVTIAAIFTSSIVGAEDGTRALNPIEVLSRERGRGQTCPALERAAETAQIAEPQLFRNRARARMALQQSACRLIQCPTAQLAKGRESFRLQPPSQRRNADAGTLRDGRVPGGYRAG
jgi:hypothetical protein